MDGQMPLKDGYEATAEIRRSLDPKIRDVKIVALTASACLGDKERCLNSGMDGYLAKVSYSVHDHSIALLGILTIVGFPACAGERFGCRDLESAGHTTTYYPSNRHTLNRLAASLASRLTSVPPLCFRRRSRTFFFVSLPFCLVGHPVDI